jgi:hypothetical protein
MTTDNTIRRLADQLWADLNRTQACLQAVRTRIDQAGPTASDAIPDALEAALDDLDDACETAITAAEEFCDEVGKPDSEEVEEASDV